MKYNNISKVLFLSFLITVKAIPIQTTKTLSLLSTSTSTRGTMDEYKKVNPKSIHTPPQLTEKLCSEIGGIYEDNKCIVNPEENDIEYSNVETTIISESTIFDTTTKTLPPKIVPIRSERTMPTEYKNIYITASGYIYEYPPKNIIATNMKNICNIRNGEYDPYRRACKYTIDNTSTRSLPPKIVPTTSTSSSFTEVSTIEQVINTEFTTTKQVFIKNMSKHCSKHGAYYDKENNICQKYPKTLPSLTSIPYHNMNTKNVPGSYTMSGYRYDYPSKHPMTNMGRICRDKDGEYDYYRGVCKYPITTTSSSSSVNKNTMTEDSSTITSNINDLSSTTTSLTSKTIPSNFLTTRPINGYHERACTMPNGEILYGTPDCKSIRHTTRSTTTTTFSGTKSNAGNAKALPSPFDIEELCKMYNAYYDPEKKSCSLYVPETTTTFSTMTISSSSIFTEEPIPEPTAFINECAKEWDQCGGLEYDGPTCCPSGFVCEILSKYYSQCVQEY